jgi:hypothetical protein
MAQRLPDELKPLLCYIPVTGCRSNLNPTCLVKTLAGEGLEPLSAPT